MIERDKKKYDSIKFSYELNKKDQERVNADYANRERMFFRKKKEAFVSYKNHPVLD